MTVETPAPSAEAMAARLWPGLVASIDDLVRRTDQGGEWTTAKSSPLWGDDRKSTPYQVSHAFQMLLNAGIDEMNGVRHLLFGRPDESLEKVVLLQAAHYVLIRSAIENFATALWILGPNERNERVARTLRWHAQNFKDQHGALDNSGVLTGPKTLDDKLKRLRDLAVQRLGAVPPKFHGYTSTAALTYATKYESNESSFFDTLTIWKLCSGFAHGRPWASLGYLSQEVEPTDDPDVASLRLTSDMARVYVAATRAMEVCQLALDRHRQLNLPPW